MLGYLSTAAFFSIKVVDWFYLLADSREKQVERREASKMLGYLSKAASFLIK